jgi:Golgi SNAP receptor complex protein 2
VIDDKNAHRRVLDVANTLGLSQDVIRWIERRSVEDKYVFWIGVVVTLLVVFGFMHYLKS